MATPGQIRHWRRRLEGLERERKSWEAHWRQLATLFRPRRSRFLDAGDPTNDGGARNRLYDGVGIQALRHLSAGLQGGLTSPARPWFALTLADGDLARADAVKVWLHATYETMVNIFNRSNFYDQMSLLYDELGAFGTGVLLVEEDSRSNIRCRTLTVGEYCLDVDHNGRVDTLYRRVRMTARQIVQAWPETVSARIRALADNDSDRWLTVLHAVEPNPNHREGRLDGPSRPWRSVYLPLEGPADEILEESGYYEFPALCPRWSTTASDVYGESPAMDARSDANVLQTITQTMMAALEKEVNPPLAASAAAGMDANINVSPGAINWVSSLAQGQHGLVPLYQVRANLAGADSFRAQLKQQIREMLYNDLFLMINQVSKNMTAREVAERTTEKMLLLGPVLDRLRSELFQPLIERVYGIAARQGMIVDPTNPRVLAQHPELAVLQGQEIKIEFVSILAQAQKQAGLGGIQNVVAFVGQLAGLAPQALDKLNVDEIIDQYAEMNGVPPDIIVSDEAVAQVRANREAEIEQAKQMAMMNQGLAMAGTGAKAARDAGLTPAEMAKANLAGGNDGTIQ